MRLFVCLDDKNGMLFNRRRQSRDQAVCEKIVSISNANKIWMNSYSAKLFGNYCGRIVVDDAFLEKADREDFCFVEDRDITPYIDRVDMIVVFRWNRYYPAEEYFPINLTDGSWCLDKLEEFFGNSHEKITMEIYTR